MFRKPPEALPEEPPAAPPPARRFTDQAGQGTIIQGGLRIEGRIEGADSVDIGGILVGDVAVEGLVRVRERGRVEGSISGTQVLVEGSVEGPRVTAQQKLELRGRAHVRSELVAATVAIAEGAEFHGKVEMRGGGGGAVTFREKRGTP
jgi:cytoskeletal protein CcmA (bactofilin family)